MISAVGLLPSLMHVIGFPVGVAHLDYRDGVSRLSLRGLSPRPWISASDRVGVVFRRDWGRVDLRKWGQRVAEGRSVIVLFSFSLSLLIIVQ